MMPIQKLDVLRAACCVAGIDGKVSEPERAILDRMGREVGVGKASLQAMVERAQRDPEFHKEQFRILKFDPTSTMSTLLEVALADKKLSDAEIDVLRILGDKLKVKPEHFDELIAAVREKLEKSG